MAEHAQSTPRSALAPGEAGNTRGLTGLPAAEGQRSDAGAGLHASLRVRTRPGAQVVDSVYPRGLRSALTGTGNRHPASGTDAVGDSSAAVQDGGLQRAASDRGTLTTAERRGEPVPFTRVDSPFAREPLEVISAFGPIEVRETGAGHQVLVLPSRSVPDESLDVTNWARRTGMGNQRTVFSVDRLTSGQDPQIVVKEAERRFTTRRADLGSGEYWWQGPRSGVRPVAIQDPLIEVQTLWEAAMLARLHQEGIPVETPQALIVNPEGRVSLVVANIDEGYGSRGSSRSISSLLEQVRDQTPLLPADDAGNGYNNLTDRRGTNHIIDVNRWRWRGRTDAVDAAMIALVGSHLP